MVNIEFPFLHNIQYITEKCETSNRYNNPDTCLCYNSKVLPWQNVRKPQM